MKHDILLSNSKLNKRNKFLTTKTIQCIWQSHTYSHHLDGITDLPCNFCWRIKYCRHENDPLKSKCAMVSCLSRLVCVQWFCLAQSSDNIFFIWNKYTCTCTISEGWITTFVQEVHKYFWSKKYVKKTRYCKTLIICVTLFSRSLYPGYIHKTLFRNLLYLGL